MGELRYTAIASLDGYVADTAGNFDWAEPDEEVHRFVNGLERPIGTYLYGRRMYEVMRFWDTPDAVEGQPEHVREYAEIWRAADKIVFSRQLDDVSTDKTTLERHLDPDAIQAVKSLSAGDVSIGGPTLAARAFAAGLVDRCHLILAPVIVGGGTAVFPKDLRVELDPVDQRGFGNGMTYLAFDIRGRPGEAAERRVDLRRNAH
jgi:dihydrofolate reductase